MSIPAFQALQNTYTVNSEIKLSDTFSCISNNFTLPLYNGAKKLSKLGELCHKRRWIIDHKPTRVIFNLASLYYCYYYSIVCTYFFVAWKNIKKALALANHITASLLYYQTFWKFDVKHHQIILAKDDYYCRHLRIWVLVLL